MKITKTRLKEIIKEEMDNNFVIDNRPDVRANCLCTDCIFNKDEYCTAEKIELNHARAEDRRIICECKTYETRRDETPI